MGFGSSSAVRYVSGDLLFLKPLGTSISICASNPFSVNGFVIVTIPFSTAYFSRISNQLQGLCSASPVDKTWIRRFCFAILGQMRRLAIRPGAIGDFIVSLPALECLQTDYFEVWTRFGNCAAGAFRRSRAVHRLHRPRFAGGHGPARAAHRRTARIRFDRLLVRRQPPRVSRGS